MAEEKLWSTFKKERIVVTAYSRKTPQSKQRKVAWNPAHVRSIASMVYASSGVDTSVFREWSEVLAKLARDHDEVSPEAMRQTIELVARAAPSGPPKEYEAEVFLGVAVYIATLEEERIRKRQGKTPRQILKEVVSRVAGHFHSGQNVTREMLRRLETSISELSGQWGLESQLVPVPA